MEKWNIDYALYNIEGVSHLYALWYLALYVIEKGLNAESVHEKMIAFYKDLRGAKSISQTIIYQQSMQSASRSKSARKKRVNAILTYLGYEGI